MICGNIKGTIGPGSPLCVAVCLWGARCIKLLYLPVGFAAKAYRRGQLKLDRRLGRGGKGSGTEGKREKEAREKGKVPQSLFPRISLDILTARMHYTKRTNFLVGHTPQLPIQMPALNAADEQGRDCKGNVIERL